MVIDTLAQAVPDQAPWWLSNGIQLLSLIGAVIGFAKWVGPRIDRVLDANVRILQTHAEMLPRVVTLLEKHDITLGELSTSVDGINLKLDTRLNRHSERLGVLESKSSAGTT